MDARHRIELLGQLRVLQGSGSASRCITRFRTQKAAALLAYLAYYRQRTHPREVLIELLWPEADLEVGRQRLSNALSTLRHQLEPPGVPAGAVILTDRFWIGLNPRAVTTDVAEFEAALVAADRARSSVERAQLLSDAIELYRGELLSGFYEDWVPPEQERLAERWHAALRHLVRHCEQLGDLPRALDYARRMVAADPLCEEAHHELMRLYAAAGQPEAALPVYRELERTLKEELGCQPSSPTRTLAQKLQGAARGRARDSQTRSRPGQSPGAPHTDSPALPPSRSSVPPLPTGTVTFLLTDIGGSAALPEQAAETIEPRRAGYEPLLRRLFRQHEGCEVRVTGDAFLVAFAHAGDALACAIAARRALAQHPWPEDTGPAGARMALHTGDVTLHRGEYQGLALYRATRILMVGHRGQILCSEATAAVVRQDLEAGVRLLDLGFYRLRDLPTPERLFQVEDPTMSQREFPPLNAEAGYQSNLPLQFTRFFGREAEITELQEMLAPPKSEQSGPERTFRPATVRLVTLAGPGGTGKTRLALEAAGRLIEAYHGAVWFVPLADLTDGDRILEAIRDAMRLPRPSGAEPLTQLSAALSKQPALLVLDNFEHLVEEGAPLLRALLDRVQTAACLVTSRQLLNLEGERGVMVQPLPTPHGKAPPEQLRMYESVQLFIDRAQAVRPDFQVTHANAPAVADLCDRLEGLPLAIELAAARAQALTPAMMLSQLACRLDFLVSRRRDAVARHRTLRAAIDWSYQLLSPELQRFFARLWVFRGGCTYEAAAAICREPLALDYLAQLRECSLVEVQAPAPRTLLPEMRFRLLEVLREYAGEKLTDEERTGLQRRHAAFYVELVEKDEPVIQSAAQDAPVAMDRLETEFDNLQAALAWSLAEEGIEAGLRIAVALGPFWHRRAHLAEGQFWFERLLERDRSVRRSGAALRIKALLSAACLFCDVNRFKEATTFAEEALGLARQSGDNLLLMDALNMFGTAVGLLGDYRRAIPFQEEALQLARQLDAPRVARFLRAMGTIAWCHADYVRADLLLEEALARYRELGFQFAAGFSLVQLARVAWSRRQYERVAPLVKEGLAIMMQSGDMGAVPQCLELLARAAYGQGERPEGLRRAAALFGAAGALRDRISAGPQIPSSQAEQDRLVASIRAVMGSEAFTAAWEEGGTMTLEQMLAHAPE